MSGTRPRRTLCAIATTVALISPSVERAAAGPGAPRECFEGSDDVGVGRWSSTPLPAVEEPPHALVHVEYRGRHPWRFSISARDPRVIYIWNLWRAFKSTDGGCTWEESFNTIETSPTPTADLTDEIVAVQAPLVVDRDAPTYMVLQRGAMPSLGIQQAGSDDWEITPMTDVAGVPLGGRAVQLWVAPSDPDTLYLEMASELVLRAGEDRSRLYASADGGRKWELRTVFVPDEVSTSDYGDFTCPAGRPPCPKVHMESMEIHPKDPRALWTGTYDGILRSVDGGRSWHNVYRATWRTFGPVDEIELVAGPRHPLRVGVFGVLATGWSEDAGRTWELRDAPRGVNERSGRPLLTPIQSAASSSRSRSLVLLHGSGGGRQAQLIGPHGWTYVSPETSRCGIRSGRAAGQCLWHAAYVAPASSYFAVERDGSHLWKLELRR